MKRNTSAVTFTEREKIKSACKGRGDGVYQAQIILHCSIHCSFKSDDEGSDRSYFKIWPLYKYYGQAITNVLFSIISLLNEHQRLRALPLPMLLSKVQVISNVSYQSSGLHCLLSSEGRLV